MRVFAVIKTCWMNSRHTRRSDGLFCGVIPANEAVSYAHNQHQSVFTYDPKASASKAYAQLVSRLVRRVVKETV